MIHRRDMTHESDANDRHLGNTGLEADQQTKKHKPRSKGNII